MMFHFLSGCMAGWPVQSGATFTPPDRYTKVKFATRLLS